MVLYNLGLRRSAIGLETYYPAFYAGYKTTRGDAMLTFLVSSFYSMILVGNIFKLLIELSIMFTVFILELEFCILIGLH